MKKIENSIDDWGMWIIDRGSNEYAYVERRVWAMPSQTKRGLYDIYELVTDPSVRLINLNGREAGYFKIDTNVPIEEVNSFMISRLEKALKKEEITA